MPKTELDGLLVIEVPDSEKITVVVKSGDLDKSDIANPEQHPIAVALRRQPASMMRECPSAKC